MQLTNTLLLLSSVASTAFAAVHQVQVSVGGALAYSPNDITAAIGDQVTFNFLNGVSSLHNTRESLIRVGILGSCCEGLLRDGVVIVNKAG